MYELALGRIASRLFVFIAAIALLGMYLTAPFQWFNDYLAPVAAFFFAALYAYALLRLFAPREALRYGASAFAFFFLLAAFLGVGGVPSALLLSIVAATLLFYFLELLKRRGSLRKAAVDLVHIGALILMAGVLMNTSNKHVESVNMTIGGTIDFHGYNLTLKSLDFDVKYKNITLRAPSVGGEFLYSEEERVTDFAGIELSKGGSVRSGTVNFIKTRDRARDKKDLFAIPYIFSYPTEDVYIVFQGVEHAGFPEPPKAYFIMTMNTYVLLVWLGSALLLFAGALLCLPEKSMPSRAELVLERESLRAIIRKLPKGKAGRYRRKLAEIEKRLGGRR